MTSAKRKIDEKKKERWNSVTELADLGYNQSDVAICKIIKVRQKTLIYCFYWVQWGISISINPNSSEENIFHGIMQSKDSQVYFGSLKKDCM